MTDRSAVHNTFTIERAFDAPVARVFAAFADWEAKKKWFASPEGWIQQEAKMDFRVGGTEVNKGGPKGGPVHSFYSRYYDIVPNERIVYAYEMYMEDKRISVSVATIEMKGDGKRTRLNLTEQGVYLDGYDNGAQREAGTRELLDALGESLKGGGPQ
jgi:uncharacterized protein YndB with AHSA1/START domain